MKPRILVGAFLCLMACLATADPKKEIQTLYNKAAAAMKQKNSTAILAMATPDLTYKAKDGRVMKRKELETQLKSQFKVVKAVTKSSQTLISIKVTGTTAEVVCRSVFEGQIPNPQTKKTMVLRAVGESKDTWVKGANGWKLKTIVEVSETTTLDGKPLQTATGTKQ